MKGAARVCMFAAFLGTHLGNAVDFDTTGETASEEQMHLWTLSQPESATKSAWKSILNDQSNILSSAVAASSMAGMPIKSVKGLVANEVNDISASGEGISGILHCDRQGAAIGLTVNGR